MACRDLQAYVINGGSADNIPVDAPLWGERSYQVRPILESKNRGRHFVRETPVAEESNRFLGQASAQPSTLREPSPAPGTKFNTGIAFRESAASEDSDLVRAAVRARDRHRVVQQSRTAVADHLLHAVAAKVRAR